MRAWVRACVDQIYTPDTPEGYCYDTDCPCFDGATGRYGRNSNMTVGGPNGCECYDKCDMTSSGCQVRGCR